MPSSYRECPACYGRLIPAAVNGRTELLDWARDDAGDYAAMQTSAGAWIGRLLGQGSELRPAEHRYRRHFDNSPRCRPAAPETRAAAAEVSDFLGTWRKARSADAKAKRGRRGRRPAPQVTGIRWTP